MRREADPGPDAILDFWFAEALRDVGAALERIGLWFGGSPDFDAEIRERFGGLPDRVARGDLAWGSSPRSRLARVLVLDQVPRNCFRGSGRAFEFDAAACRAAGEALATAADAALQPLEAAFLYLPLVHAEVPALQERCVALFEALEVRAPAGLEACFAEFTDSARRHREVIRRFGRFPHRNAALARPSTAAEAAYLASGGDAFGTPGSGRGA